MFGMFKQNQVATGDDTPRVTARDGASDLPSPRLFRSPDLSMPYGQKVQCVRDILTSIPFSQADEFLADVLAPRGGITMKTLGESLIKAGNDNLKVHGLG